MYLLYYRSSKNQICELSVDYLDRIKSVDEIMTSYENVLNIFIILPHFKTINSEQAAVLLRINQFILNELARADLSSDEQICKLFHLWTFVLITVIQVEDAKEQFLKNLACDKFLGVLLKHCQQDICTTAVLRVLDFFIFAASASASAINHKLCLKIEQEVVKHLASPFHMVSCMLLKFVSASSNEIAHKSSVQMRENFVLFT